MSRKIRLSGLKNVVQSNGMFRHPVSAFGGVIFILAWNILAFVALRPDCAVISLSSRQNGWCIESEPTGNVRKTFRITKSFFPKGYEGEYQFNGKKYSFTCKGTAASFFNAGDKVQMEIYKSCPRYARIKGTLVGTTQLGPEKALEVYLYFGSVGILFLIVALVNFTITLLRYIERKNREKQRFLSSNGKTGSHKNEKREKAFMFFMFTLTLWYLLVIGLFLREEKAAAFICAATAFYGGLTAMGGNACFYQRKKKEKNELKKEYPVEIKIFCYILLLFCLPLFSLFILQPAIGIFFLGFILMMIQIARMSVIPD